MKPLSTGPPTVAIGSLATIADGVLLTASPGSWDGASGLAFTYRFQSCDQTCTHRRRPAPTPYTLRPADVGKSIQVQVTATAGPVDGLTSQATATSVADRRRRAARDRRSDAQRGHAGHAAAGRIAAGRRRGTARSGSSSPTPSRAATRPGRRAPSCRAPARRRYTLHAADLGSRSRRRCWRPRAIARPTSPRPGPSAFTLADRRDHAAPACRRARRRADADRAGTLVQDGVTLSADLVDRGTTGALTSPTSTSSARPPATCTPVGSPTRPPTYLLQPTDVGMPMEVVVTASANGASTSVTSDPTVPVQPLNDGNASIAVPVVQQDGQVFTSSDGSWHGATGLDHRLPVEALQRRTDAARRSRRRPPSTYTATVDDVGDTLRVAVSASAGGSAVTQSAGDSSPTAAIAPLSTTAPTLERRARRHQAPDRGRRLLGRRHEPDRVLPVRPLRRGGQHLQHDRSRLGGSNVYTLGLGDIGSTIRVIVFAKKNGSASIASIASPSTAVITPLLDRRAGAPAGAAQDGQAADGRRWDVGRPGRPLVPLPVVSLYARVQPHLRRDLADVHACRLRTWAPGCSRASRRSSGQGAATRPARRHARRRAAEHRAVLDLDAARAGRTDLLGLDRRVGRRRGTDPHLPVEALRPRWRRLRLHPERGREHVHGRARRTSAHAPRRASPPPRAARRLQPAIARLATRRAVVAPRNTLEAGDRRRSDRRADAVDGRLRERRVGRRRRRPSPSPTSGCAATRRAVPAAPIAGATNPVVHADRRGRRGGRRPELTSATPSRCRCHGLGERRIHHERRATSTGNDRRRGRRRSRRCRTSTAVRTATRR